MRHTAAAPAVDVLAGGDPVFTNLSNPDEAKADLAAGTVSASVAATGTTDPVIGPADVTVKEGSATIVYAWGSLEDDNLAVAVQTIDGLHSTRPASPPAPPTWTLSCCPSPSVVWPCSVPSSPLAPRLALAGRPPDAPLAGTLGGPPSAGPRCTGDGCRSTPHRHHPPAHLASPRPD